MGSGNGLARSAKIPVAPTKALDIIFAGRAEKIDGFFINEKFSLMIMSGLMKRGKHTANYLANPFAFW